MDQNKRFLLAMGLYAALAVLIWLTMDAGAVTIRRENGAIIEIPFRGVALGILGLFAALTVLRWRVDQREARREQESLHEQE
jgi:ABC-type transport system involved in cytochrome c biogenesis permease subunit